MPKPGNFLDPKRIPFFRARLDGDTRAVVDLDLKFRGIDGLWVVDASVILALPSANINACVFMIAEKAADKILGRQALAPEVFPYYRAVKQD